MQLQDFVLHQANWATPSDREALRALRTEVFIVEQAVPEALEWDALDAGSTHVLARDERGQPIACGRLTPEHKIGRMAVVGAWRGKGVGRAVLRELIARARALGWPEISLDAQVQAMPFYAREGFVAEGEVFDDAGIPHRLMRLALSAPSRVEAPRPADRLPAGDRSEVAAARLVLLRQARHRLAIYLPELGPDLLSSEDELGELRRIAISGRGAEIRILLHDAEAALRQGHRLVALVQRLPSSLLIRTPTEEQDLAYGSAYVLDDAGGYLFLPEAARPQGRAARQDRPEQAALLRHFDEVWERALPARALQPLNI